jgi:hypothetical protein
VAAKDKATVRAETLVDAVVRAYPHSVSHAATRELIVIVAEELRDVFECDECDLCEDHHA